MQHFRLLIAVALSLLLFLMWDFFFVDREEIQRPTQNLQHEQIVEERPPEELYARDIETDMAYKAPLQRYDFLQPVHIPRTITVTSPLYSVQISEKGAVFKSFLLQNHRESVDVDSPLKELLPENIDTGTVLLGFTGTGLPGLKDAVFSADIVYDFIDVYDTPREILFSWVSPEGVTIEKRYFFSPESYLIGLDVTVKNDSYQTIHEDMTLSLMWPSLEGRHLYGFEGPSALIDGRLEQITAHNEEIRTGNLKWIAAQDRYFMSSIIPLYPVETSMRAFIKQENILEVQYVHPTGTIRPGTQHVFKVDLFFGPKSMEALSKAGHDLGRVIDFGIISFLARPCLWFMNFVYSFIPNYGIAIIILTVITKLILWPLGTKSYKSMNEMRKIQPLMMEIREKYKDDRKRMNEELMGLYKVYKINPMAGCLPILLQMPIFFALFRMLYEAVELRHAHFFLWINDLSAPDRLFDFGFYIPFMHPPIGIPVLTIIMGATMFLQMKMTPTPGDPMQAKIMMLMPIIFTVFFVNFSSGLVLYWLIHNVLTIAQQYHVSKKTT